jgi:hypothetical protein
MTDLRKAAEMALEALNSKYIVNCGAWMLQQDQAAEALRQALAQTEQEPYGYFHYDMSLDAWVQNRENTKGVAFYTAPPKREWIGLTRLELDIATLGLEDLSDCYKAIEAKLKEKNA